jgi:hypothetical protein
MFPDHTVEFLGGHLDTNLPSQEGLPERGDIDAPITV